MRTIAIINAKGGVGKTTSALVVADILSREYKKRVLVIDLDPQLNTSRQMGVYTPGGLCVAHLLVDKTLEARSVIKHSPVYEGVDVIPCDKALEAANMQVLMETSTMQQLRLKRSRNISTINGLALTQDVLVPVTADSYSLDGVMDIVSVVEDVQDYNDGIRLTGIFLTKYEKIKACRETLEHLQSALPGLVMDTYIRKSATISASTFAEQPLLDYAGKSSAADDYRSLVREYLERRD